MNLQSMAEKLSEYKNGQKYKVWKLNQNTRKVSITEKLGNVPQFKKQSYHLLFCMEYLYSPLFHWIKTCYRKNTSLSAAMLNTNLYIFIHIYELKHNFINAYLNCIHVFPKVKRSWKQIYRTYTNIQVFSWKSKWLISGLCTQFPFYQIPCHEVLVIILPWRNSRIHATEELTHFKGVY